MVNAIDAKITQHTNDTIQKYTNALFRNATLEFYGIETAPIKELINPELPKVEVSGGAADIVFLLEDDTYLHFAFETGHNTAAVAKCFSYDARLFERDGRKIHTVIIYTADVKTRPSGLSFGTMRYYPDVILMTEYDGDAVFKELEAKIKTGQELTEIDMLNLALLPLMRHTMPPRELAAESIRLAQTIPDITRRNACTAAAVAFANKFLSKTDMEKIKGVLAMTDLVGMIVEDAVGNAIKNRDMEIAKNALKMGFSIENIAGITSLDESTIKQLQTEMK